jgi:hypothetical protein
MHKQARATYLSAGKQDADVKQFPTELRRTQRGLTNLKYDVIVRDL